MKNVEMGKNKPNLHLFKTLKNFPYFQNLSILSKTFQTIRPFFWVFASSGLSPCFVPFLGGNSHWKFDVLTFKKTNINRPFFWVFALSGVFPCLVPFFREFYSIEILCFDFQKKIFRPFFFTGDILSKNVMFWLS